MTYKDINWYGASLLIGGVVVVILAAYFVWQGMLNEDILEFTGLIVFLFGLFTIGFMLLILILAIADSVVGKLIMWKYLRNSNHWREALIEARNILDKKYPKK